MLDSEKIKFLCTAALACRQRETSVLTSAPQAACCGEECKEQQREKGGERTKARYEHAFQNTDLELPKTHEQTTIGCKSRRDTAASEPAAELVTSESLKPLKQPNEFTGLLFFSSPLLAVKHEKSRKN